MLSRIYNAVRAYLGDIATVVGCFGLFLFVAGLPLSYFATYWLPTPNPPSRADAARDFWEIVWFRLFPLSLISMALLAYGFYESLKEGQRKLTESQSSCWRCWANSTWTKKK